MANSPRRTKTVLMIVVPVLALLLVAGAVTAFVLTRNAIDAVNQSAAAKTDDYGPYGDVLRSYRKLVDDYSQSTGDDFSASPPRPTTPRRPPSPKRGAQNPPRLSSTQSTIPQINK